MEEGIKLWRVAIRKKVQVKYLDMPDTNHCWRFRLLSEIDLSFTAMTCFRWAQ